MTTGSITGTVLDPQKAPVPGASVLAVHEPSGTRYEATTRADGRFSLPGMRVGGPYTVTATLSGFQPQTVKEVVVNLGVEADLVAHARPGRPHRGGDGHRADAPRCSAPRAPAPPPRSTGRPCRPSPPSRDRINDFARLTPQYTGGAFGGSFVGQDNRLNNITIDGSYFNNSFGLGGQPGDRTGVTPISTAAIEEIQVNVAPYDVRQGNFVGAGVNMVTRSGGNQFRGSAYYWFRDNEPRRHRGEGPHLQPRHVRLPPLRRPGPPGPIIKDKLFFFGSYRGRQADRSRARRSAPTPAARRWPAT